MSESHVLDIRKKTTQERLRGDHIDLLYQLDDAMKLNDQHEKEIDRLKKLLAQTLKPDTEVVVEESGEIIDGHLQTIEELHSVVADLINEVKTMKTKEILTLKSHQKLVERAQQEVEEKTAEGAALQASHLGLVQELQAELLAARESMPGTDNGCDSSERERGAMLLLERKCVELEKQVEASIESARQTEQRTKENCEAFAIESDKRNETYLKQKSVILELEGEKSQLSAELSDAEEVICELRSKLLAEERNVAALLACPPPSPDQDEGVEKAAVPVAEQEVAVTTESSTQTDKVVEKKEDASKEASMANQFKDYVQLKKEIVSLKLLLAHKESGKPGRSEGAGHRGNIRPRSDSNGNNESNSNSNSNSKSGGSSTSGSTASDVLGNQRRSSSRSLPPTLMATSKSTPSTGVKKQANR